MTPAGGRDAPPVPAGDRDAPPVRAAGRGARRTRAGTRQARPAGLLYRICSILLRYPDRSLFDLLADVDAAACGLASGDAAQVRHVLDWLRATDPTEAAAHYVATFDNSRRRGLYLTYYRHGDTRARGMALLALKHVYREAGHEPPGDELPDYLPLMLEFAAVAPDPGARVLGQCRAGLELLRTGLREAGSPYRYLLDAICAALPAMPPRARDQLNRLAMDGPPAERVGLEPFAPPEYVVGGHE